MCSFQILVEGIRGNGDTGDIAIHDLKYNDKPCKLSPPNAIYAAHPQTTSAQSTTLRLTTPYFSLPRSTPSLSTLRQPTTTRSSKCVYLIYVNVDKTYHDKR